MGRISCKSYNLHECCKLERYIQKSMKWKGVNYEFIETAASILEAQQDNPIEAIGSYISEHIEQNWEKVLTDNREKLLRAYNEGGDMAYGTYLNLLFLPVHRQFKEMGIRPAPKFPGDFDISRNGEARKEPTSSAGCGAPFFAGGRAARHHRHDCISRPYPVSRPKAAPYSSRA